MDTTVAPTNRAAWLPAKGARLEVGPAPYPQPGPEEIVVRNGAVAVNPLEWIIQVGAGIVFGWLTYPTILGSDLAGEVVAIGRDVSRFCIGDRVLAHAIGTDQKRNRAAEGAFQRYTVVLERMTSAIPHDMPYERAAVIPLGLSTAACALFQSDQLALAYPSAVPARRNATVLIWGGSTSVGCNAIQLAVAAGYDVVTTCSPKNFDYVKRLGASAAFDYRDPAVVAKIIAWLTGKTIAGAIAIGGSSAAGCIDVARACSGRKFVAIVTFPIDFSSAPGRLAVIAQAVPAMAQLTLKALFGRVRTNFIFGSTLAGNDVSYAIYRDFLPSALADGRFVPAPEPLVVGNGLEQVQAGLDAQRRGVSAAKVVISLAPSA
jgi:NADPH:quinone reductase-like Zn-dependent oxidoreductase